MAKLPAPEDYGTPLPQATRGITGVRAATGMGQAIAGIGDVLKQESDKLSDVEAEDALNKLRMKRIEMSVGPDGFSQVKGGQVISAKPLEIFPQRFDKEADAIGAALNSPRAKQRYAQVRASERAVFGNGLLTHVANETSAYAADTANATVDTEAKTLSIGYKDAATVASSFKRLNEVVASEAARQGLEGKTLEAFQAKVMGAGHSAILSAALTNGDTSYAKDYLATHRTEMTGQQVAHYDPLIKNANDFEAGKALGLEAHDMLTSGKPAADVEAYLVKKAKSPGMLSTAQGTLGQLTQAADRADRQGAGAIISDFYKAPNGVTANKLLSSESFASLSPAKQGELRGYLFHQVQSANDHARALSDRAEAKDRMKWDQNVPALARFSALADSDALATMTTQEVLSHAPEIGPKLVATLESIRKERVSQTASFKIDPVLINEALPEALQKASSDKEKSQVSAFKGIVYRGLTDWKSRNPGKVPTPEDQLAIVRAASKDFVDPGMIWDTHTPAYKLKPMPEDFITGARGYAKSKGLPTPSYNQLLEQWAKQKDSK